MYCVAIPHGPLSHFFSYFGMCIGTCRALLHSQGHPAAVETSVYVIGDAAYEGGTVGLGPYPATSVGSRRGSGQRVSGGDFELQPMGPSWYAPPAAPLYGDRQAPVQARRPPIGRPELPMRPKSARGIRPASAIGRPSVQGQPSSGIPVVMELKPVYAGGPASAEESSHSPSSVWSAAVGIGPGRPRQSKEAFPQSRGLVPF